MRVDRIGTVFFAAALFAAAGSWGCGGGDTGTGGGGGGTTTSSTTTTTTTTTTTSGMTTSSQPGTIYLGLECAADADCGMDGKCIQVSDSDNLIGGGAAGGYCTKLCSSDADCPGQGSTCVDDGNGNGECFQGCVFGTPELSSLADELDPDKCHGREDVTCRQLQSGAEVCVPTCGSDSQCDGRSCDPRFGVCVDTPTPGKALGEKCDTEAMMTDCAGICIGITGGKSMCTSPCGMAGAVLESLDCGGVGVGFCLYSVAGTGVGDMGYCAQSCTAQDGCQLPDFACFNLGLPDNGICLDTEACSTDADCGNYPQGSACVDTTVGKRCMSPEYPLGSIDPGTGGGGAGGGGAGGGGAGGVGGAAGGMGGATGGTGGM